jgi:hypothetical protein
MWNEMVTSRASSEDALMDQGDEWSLHDPSHTIFTQSLLYYVGLIYVVLTCHTMWEWVVWKLCENYKIIIFENYNLRDRPSK